MPVTSGTIQVRCRVSSCAKSTRRYSGGGLFDAREHRQQADADAGEAAAQQLAEPLPQVLPGAELAQRRQHGAQRERQRRQ